MPAHFPVCPAATPPQIGPVRQLLVPLLLALAAPADARAVATAPAVPAPSPAPASPAALARYNTVAIKTASTSIIIGSVTMTMTPFQRKKVVYSSNYYAKVFPYFFYSERGRIWIVVTDEDLQKVARGESIDYKGHAVSDSGEERRIDGRATPTGPTTGKIRVRVFVTRHISLTYDTTYELQGQPGPPAPVTPK